MGYEYTLKFIMGEFEMPADSQIAYDAYRKVFEQWQ
jgi:hypothetical protein